MMTEMPMPVTPFLLSSYCLVDAVFDCATIVLTFRKYCD